LDNVLAGVHSRTVVYDVDSRASRCHSKSYKQLFRNSEFLIRLYGMDLPYGVHSAMTGN